MGNTITQAMASQQRRGGKPAKVKVISFKRGTKKFMVGDIVAVQPEEGQVRQQHQRCGVVQCISAALPASDLTHATWL